MYSFETEIDAQAYNVSFAFCDGTFWALVKLIDNNYKINYRVSHVTCHMSSGQPEVGVLLLLLLYFFRTTIIPFVMTWNSSE